MNYLKIVLLITIIIPLSTYCQDCSIFRVNSNTIFNVENDTVRYQLIFKLRNVVTPCDNCTSTGSYKFEIIGKYDDSQIFEKMLFVEDDFIIKSTNDNRTFEIPYNKIFDLQKTIEKHQPLILKNVIFFNNYADERKLTEDINPLILNWEKVIKSFAVNQYPELIKIFNSLDKDSLLALALNKNKNDSYIICKDIYNKLSDFEKDKMIYELGFLKPDSTSNNVSVDSISRESADKYFTAAHNALYNRIDIKIDNKIDSLSNKIDTIINVTQITEEITKDLPLLNIKGNLGITIDYNNLNLFNASSSCFGPIIRISSQAKLKKQICFDSYIGLLGLRGIKFQTQVGMVFRKESSTQYSVFGALFKGSYKEKFSSDFSRRYYSGGVGMYYDYYNQNYKWFKKVGLNSTFGLKETLFAIKTVNSRNENINLGFLTAGINSELKHSETLINLDFIFTGKSLIPDLNINNAINLYGIVLSLAIFLKK